MAKGTYESMNGASQGLSSPSQTVIFISHAHMDEGITARLLELFQNVFEVPEKAILCTSVPGYGLPLGKEIKNTLRDELSTTRLVLAIISSNSMKSPWVMYELGAVWGGKTDSIPLFVGRITEQELPDPVRQSIRLGGNLSDSGFVQRLLEHIESATGWRRRNTEKYYERDSIENFIDEIQSIGGANLLARRSRIGEKQTCLLDYIGRCGLVEQRSVQEFCDEEDIETDVYYRLEALRLLGFLKCNYIGRDGEYPTYSWGLSEQYKKALQG